MSRLNNFIILLFVCIAVVTSCPGCTDKKPNLDNCNSIERQPAISPDYTNTTLPPNIAPTNFIIKEAASAYFVRVSSKQGEDINILSRSAEIRIPIKPWKKLLNENRNKSLLITIFIRNEECKWSRFAPIENHIAAEEIDSHLVYRLMKPLYQYWDKLGIYQRDLTGYDERPIVLNTAMGKNCVNCHSFHNYNPDRMIFHMRAGAVGTSMILAYDGETHKVDTSTSFNHATSYRSWHPNGQIIAFAFNTVKQIFHAAGKNLDVYDRASDLLLYNVKTNTITTSPKISSAERMETYPEWSPDGRYLYFCSSPALESFDKDEHPLKKIRYDLMRISYDAQTDSWGEVEPVLLASKLGRSVAHSKFSPDGRYVLLCMSEYSYFPLYMPDSDLYLLDTETMEFHKPDNINSDRAESYHCFSSNGRWVVFSSKRQDGQSTHPYFSYFDTSGHFSKPFLLPQKNPAYQQSRVIVYNVPEFVKGPVKIPPQKLVKTAWSEQIVKAKLDPKVSTKQSEETEETPYESNLHDADP
ncbi:MAG: PD40 domain-containing protein [Sedimentisphaerales bacterium]|nr:PD40 domain-containing protein [Sedimentisphaerales bacterium]